jgi:hypothetical protein
MNQPRPITDPAPALLSNASKEAHGAGSRQHARRSAGGRGGAGSSSGAAEHPSARPKFQGSVWAADMFSLGPAPAALAAADGAAVILDSLVSNTDSLRQTHLVSCLETMLTLTKLAGAMSKEAAGKAVSSWSTRAAGNIELHMRQANTTLGCCCSLNPGTERGPQ